MVEPAKPFACSMPDCGKSFTNEDHLHVHTKKHDMVLQGLEQKVAFVADQTPTPTRFIRNCEEVGLFQDLQNDNPFEEGFKRAMESAKHGFICLEHPLTASDELHTPQMVFPLSDGDSALFTSNNQRNITISRSSSDESGAIKEYETTTISKLTNEVTTISRRVEKHEDKHTDEADKQESKGINKSVSYTNNVIKITKDNIDNKQINISFKENEILPPIMTQKSFDYVVDSLTSDLCNDKDKNIRNVDKQRKERDEEYTVTITTPGGKQIKMKSVEEQNKPFKIQNETKEKLKSVINNKVLTSIPVVQSLPVGTFIPVTIISNGINSIPNSIPNKIPIAPLVSISNEKQIKRRKIKEIEGDEEKKQLSRDDKDARVAASRRYRIRLKETMNRQELEIAKLRENNKKLNGEVAALKLLITRHMNKCPQADDLRTIRESLSTHKCNET